MAKKKPVKKKVIKRSTKKTSKNLLEPITQKPKVLESEQKLIEKDAINKLHHANLYYLVMIVSLIMSIFFLVQGIRFHVNDEITMAMFFYTETVFLLVVAKASHNRGKGHYHYHEHLKHKF